MQIIGLDHVQLAMPPEGEETARQFYEHLLGLTELPKPAQLKSRGGCWFAGSGAIVHLGIQEEFVPARKAHPAFLVTDLEECRQKLQQAGAPVVEEQALPHVQRLYTMDPFGNRLELIQDGYGFSQRTITGKPGDEPQVQGGL